MDAHFVHSSQTLSMQQAPHSVLSFCYILWDKPMLEVYKVLHIYATKI